MAEIIGIAIRYVVLIWIIRWLLGKAGLGYRPSCVLAGIIAFAASLLLGSWGRYDAISTDTILAVLPAEAIGALIVTAVMTIRKPKAVKPL